MKQAWITVGLPLIAWAIPCPAQSVRYPSNEALNSRFDVAGVRLGMLYSQALAELTKRGYSHSSDPRFEEEQACDWNCTVSSALSPRNGSPVSKGLGVSFIHLNGPDKQSVEVNFAPSPQGQVVTRVAYVIGGDRISETAFKAKANQKYGVGKKGDIWYCSIEEPDCEGGDNNGNLYPSVDRSAGFRLSKPNPGGYHHLVLHEGQILKARRKKVLVDTIDRLTPQNAKPNF